MDDHMNPADGVPGTIGMTEAGQDRSGSKGDKMSDDNIAEFSGREKSDPEVNGPHAEAQGPSGSNGSDQTFGAENTPDESISGKSAREKRKVTSLIEVEAVRVYLNRIHAREQSFDRAAITDTSGKYPEDLFTIRFAEDGKVKVYEKGERQPLTEGHLLPSEEEQAAISAEWATVRFPQILPLHRIGNAPPQMKEMMKKAGPNGVFEFREASTAEGQKDRRILVVQVRVPTEGKDGKPGKDYRPWTYWDDKVWRMMHPPGQLPMWGMEQLEDHKVAFLHEGAKAAAHARWLAEGKTREAREARKAHPWGRDLENAAHLGWIGGAKNPGRTDWSVLRKHGIERVCIVCDNDDEGRSAWPEIARRSALTAAYIDFGQRFGVSFDLGDDPFDKEKGWKGGARDRMPSLMEMAQPATWLAERKPDGGYLRLTAAGKREWVPIQDEQIFVNAQMPWHVIPFTAFDDAVLRLCAVGKGSVRKELLRESAIHAHKTSYVPSAKTGVDHIPGSGKMGFNIFKPSAIKPKEGDAALWEKFLEYLFPVEEERKQMKRWMATHIARPDIRMSWGVLLISEAQGVGKSTLTDKILTPLTGCHNTAFPSDADLRSDFNGWAARKRLAVLAEIYQGGGWDFYNRMKSVITDDRISVNEKYEKPREYDNWLHVIGQSNRPDAIKVDGADRRWFLPDVAEAAWPREKFIELNRWIVAGGLEIIAHWAATFEARGEGAYVVPEEQAPKTKRREEVVLRSMKLSQKLVLELLDGIEDGQCVSSKVVLETVRMSEPKATVEDIAAALKAAGLIKDTKTTGKSGRTRRIKLFGGRSPDHLIWGDAEFWEAVEAHDGELGDFLAKSGKERLFRPEGSM
ncbi:primase-helicase family protein [Actibacterium sp. XHP0104]|uniref:primase-helicase family protein n=1 Tax=Actibacterium sp. XHP0104 TaxID=2984335 RepID=UPI0021E94288|nr:primase-helicase family protein [Actibacterium sp. XHP0104]MCV2881705.1 DUF5906 domain-containing protein [Actibacterium sp. XHP0104]